MAENSLNPAATLIAIGGSAGSLDVLMQILPTWNLPDHTAVVIVLHRKPDGESQLTDVLNAKCPWPVSEARDKERIKPCNIYIAPADYHLLIETDHTFSLDYSEKVNYSRPSIDVTLETAAIAYKQKLICLLLSGANMDGSEGLIFARSQNAFIIIQDPRTAIAPFMPQQAIASMKPDRIIAPENMIACLMEIVTDVS
jgi:two-component system chemotaxis response regulator CheB